MTWNWPQFQVLVTHWLSWAHYVVASKLGEASSVPRDRCDDAMYAILKQAKSTGVRSATKATYWNSNGHEFGVMMKAAFWFKISISKYLLMAFAKLRILWYQTPNAMRRLHKLRGVCRSFWSMLHLTVGNMSCSVHAIWPFVHYRSTSNDLKTSKILL